MEEPTQQEQEVQQEIPQDDFEPRLNLSELYKATSRVRAEVGKVVVGQHQMIDLILAAILADGHVLIEGVPGIAKTLTAKLMARTLSVGFSRIQFTPDLMPSDILGTSIFNQRNSEFEFRRGPIFSNVVLIDEINRAPAKTQAALFEVMEERQVTADGTTWQMGTPFMVMATQNPIEQEGTYRLPEAQLDRFLFKIEVTYPNLEDEVRILNEHQQRNAVTNLAIVEPVITPEMLASLREKVRNVHVEPHLVRYIAQIVAGTRDNASLFLGASPRASLAMLNGAKSFAAMMGRDFITPEDIRQVVAPVLRHRILLTPEREMEGLGPEEVIKQIIEKIEVPR